MRITTTRRSFSGRSNGFTPIPSSRAGPSADWFEREIYDMYGVRFDDHPDLARILLPDDADFHALLKDFGRIEDAEDADG